MAKSPPPRQSSPAVSSLASKVLSGAKPSPTKGEVKTLAASVLSQDQTPSKKK